MDRRVVRIDIVGILTSLAAVYFNILSEIADILRGVVLIICDLRMTHVRVAVQIVMNGIICQPHLLSSLRGNIGRHRSLHLIILPGGLHFDILIWIDGQVLFLFVHAIDSPGILFDLVDSSLAAALLRGHVLVGGHIRIGHTECLLVLIALDITLVIAVNLYSLGSPDIFLDYFSHFAIICLATLSVKSSAQSRSCW